MELYIGTNALIAVKLDGRRLPADLNAVSEDTALVGDEDAFIAYLENGQAGRDWDERLLQLKEECDAFLEAHRHVWAHIVIQKT